MKVRSSVSRRISLIFIGLLASLFLVELSLRFYLFLTTPINPMECRREDPIVHHGYKPNTACRYKTKEWDTEIKINSIGLRSNEVGQKTGYRILVIGDSFTAAESVDLEKTAVYLTEKRLNGEGKKVEIINAGVPSYSPVLEYLWLRERGLKLSPDLVVLNFDLGDISGDNFLSEFFSGSTETLDEDFSLEGKEDAFQEGKEASTSVWDDTSWQLKTTRAENPSTLSFITRIKFWLHTHLKSYNFFAEATKKTIRKIKGIPEEPIYVLGDVKNDFEFITRSEENALKMDVYQLPLQNLIRIKNLLDKEGIPFVVVYFPHGHQVSEKEWVKGRAFYGIEQNKIYTRKGIEVLVKISQDAEIEAYDVSDYFLRAASDFPLYFPFDGHFTEDGNKVFASALFDIVKDKIK